MPKQWMGTGRDGGREGRERGGAGREGGKESPVEACWLGLTAVFLLAYMDAREAVVTACASSTTAALVQY